VQRGGDLELYRWVLFHLGRCSTRGPAADLASSLLVLPWRNAELGPGRSAEV